MDLPSLQMMDPPSHPWDHLLKSQVPLQPLLVQQHHLEAQQQHHQVMKPIVPW